MCSLQSQSRGSSDSSLLDKAHEAGSEISIAEFDPVSLQGWSVWKQNTQEKEVNTNSEKVHT